MRYILAIIWYGKTTEDVFKCDSYQEAIETVENFKRFWSIDRYEIRPQMEG